MMEYRAVGSRCAFDFGVLPAEALPFADRILEDKGFRRIDVDIIAEARSCIGRSRFVKRVHPDRAPDEVNCSSLVWWLLSRRGVGLPRLAIQQRGKGRRVSSEEMIAGDLIFMTARLNLYLDDPRDGVGHVGLVTERGTVIHAKGVRSGVVEEKPDRFLAPSRFRGVRRLIDPFHRVETFEIPDSEFVETSDDIKWLILLNLRQYRT